jgi:hypothetical protein
MIHRQLLASLLVTLSAGSAWAQQYETDPATGRQYMVTSRIPGKQLQTDTQIVSQPYTVYSDRATVEYQPSYRNVYTPVTEYSWEPYLANRWNPFAQPGVAYHYVPHTRWDVRTETTQIPVTRHETVAEQRTAQVPVTTQRWVDVEHVTRMAVNNTGSDPFSATASAPKPIGGVATLQQDPPRQGSTFGPK